MNIRLASDKDYDAVLALMRQLNPEDSIIDDLSGRQLFKEIVDSNGLSIYLAEVERKPVATCYLNVMPNLTRSGRSYALIENVVTDRDHRFNTAIAKR